MNPILGYFIFINLGDGCLGSKYGHTLSLRLLAESATRVSEPNENDDFIGEYIVTWLDSINPVEFTQARLKIARKTGSNSQYTIIWHREGDRRAILYHGEGMLCESGLVGSYWNTPVENLLP